MKGRIWLNIIALLCVVCFFSACSVTPVSLTDTELLEQTESFREELNKSEPVNGPISLYEAFARALSHNLDLRLELTERVLARRELELARYDELPQLVGNFGYAGRNNFSGASSRSLITGVQSLASSTSSDRDVFTGDIGLSWNILDFGLSYIRSKQAADRILIADEQRRKVVNDLVKDVRALYWRAVSHDRLDSQMKNLLQEVELAINQSKEIEKSQLETPLVALTYQRELIGIKRELEELKQELSLSKIQLAALMDLEPGTDYLLIVPEREEKINGIGISANMMEELALVHRSELREISYQERINAAEAKAGLLELLPNINLNIGENYTSNSFIFNTDWLSYGSRVSWNLLNVFKIPAGKRAHKAQELVLKARKLAVSMAVITQVHVSLAQFSSAKQEYNTASQYFDIQSRILEKIEAEAAVNAISQQSVIRERMNSVVAEIRYDIAYADIQNSYADMYAAIGVDPVPHKIDVKSINDLSDDIEYYFENFKSRIDNFSLNTFWLAPIANPLSGEILEDK